LVDVLTDVLIMATLTKDSRARSPYWIACYTAADGRRLKKSTRETDRKRALEVALTLERAESMARRGTLTEVRARELLAEVLERTTGETLPFHTVEGFLRDWLAGKEVSKAANTFVNYAQTVKGFLAHLGARAKLSLTAMTAKDVSSFRDAELSAGKNPNTVRYAVKHLRVPFNAARRLGIISTNPAEAVELPGATKGEDGGETSRQPFSPEEVATLLEAALACENGKDWQGAILFAFCTGARISDTASMTWNAIDVPGKLLTFRPQKTGKVVTMPLHPALEAHLLELPAPDSGKAFVFPALAGKTSGTLAKGFARVMKRAGMVSAVLTTRHGGKGRTVHAHSFHSLRHSFNSQMANAGIAQEVRMKLTGHTSTGMNKTYTRHELEPLRAAIAAIPSPVGKAK
jgi:integrase